MQSYVLPYLLGACALGLVLYPVVRAVRGHGDRVDLVIALSIPVLVALVMFVGSRPAFAQGIDLLKPNNVVGPYSHWFPPGQTGWAVTNPPTTSSIPASGGTGPSVAVNGGGTAVVTRPQMPNVSVPVNTRTVIPAAAAAAAAGRAAAVARAAMGPVGAAWLAWDIYKTVKDSGVSVCPPPDFFCHPPTINYDRQQLGWRLNGFSNVVGSLSSNLSYLFNNQCRGCSLDKETFDNSVPSSPTVTWRIKSTDGGYMTFSSTFIEGTLNKTETPGPPMTDGDLENHMKGQANNDSTGTKAKNYYDAAMDADQKMRQSGKPGVPPGVLFPSSGTTTSVTSSPVTVGPDNLGSKTGTDAMGNPTSTTTTGTTTITPTVTGSGSSTSITYNISYNTTNTTTNPSNPSAPPRTETQVVVIRIEPGSAPAPSNPSPQLEIPNDYNKEVTQQKILDVLNGEGVPDGSDLSSTEAEDQVKGSQATITQAIERVTPGALGLESWLPQVPTAACVNPEVANPITGKLLPVEICKPVSLFQKFISAVICVFVLFGCVREVQAAIKS